VSDDNVARNGGRKIGTTLKAKSDNLATIKLDTILLPQNSSIYNLQLSWLEKSKKTLEKYNYRK
jgi:hypothetical protein